VASVVLWWCTVAEASPWHILQDNTVSVLAAVCTVNQQERRDAAADGHCAGTSKDTVLCPIPVVEIHHRWTTSWPQWTSGLAVLTTLMLLDTAFTDDNTDKDDQVQVAITSDGQRGLLLVLQAGWRKCRLKRYDNMCLPDATHKTTSYAVPLFFLCVCKNVTMLS